MSGCNLHCFLILCRWKCCLERWAQLSIYLSPILFHCLVGVSIENWRHRIYYFLTHFYSQYNCTEPYKWRLCSTRCCIECHVPWIFNRIHQNIIANAAFQQYRGMKVVGKKTTVFMSLLVLMICSRRACELFAILPIEYWKRWAQNLLAIRCQWQSNYLTELASTISK